MYSDEESPIVVKECSNCEKEHSVVEEEVTCPNCGTVTLQEK